MTLLTNLLSILRIAAKRLWSNKGLALSLLAGWTTAVGLSISVPLYADAINHRILREELETVREGTPPFAFMFRYIGSWHDPVEWEDASQVDAYLSGRFAADLELPVESTVRYFRTPNFRLFPVSDAAYASLREPLEWVGAGFISNVEEHIELLEGVFPAEVGPAPQAVEVLLHHQLAEDLGLQVGEEYVIFGEDDQSASETSAVQIILKVVGVWKPTDPTDTFWFYRPSSLDRLLLTTESNFHQRFSPLLSDEVYLGLWYLLLDGSEVYAEDVDQLLSRIGAAETRVDALLPQTSLDISPAEAMSIYRVEARRLTILLSVFSIPVLGLVLYFVALSAGMAVRRQQTEIAVLRSRGMSRSQIVGVYFLEGLALGALSFLMGVLLGEGIALGMGQVRSFLSLAIRPPLELNVTWSSLRFGVGAIALAMLATLLPALSAAGHTVVTHKQEQARALRRPLWQRLYLDLFLLAPPSYGYYLLRQQGTISVNLGGGATSDPFQNPLLFLVPTFFIFAFALLFIRVFPILMSALAWIAGWLPGAPSVLALRYLARSSQQYTGPLLLLILTLGLAAFTASMALTLDNHLVDQLYYQVGSDLQLKEIGESTTPQSGTVGLQIEPSAEEAAAAEEDDGPRYLFLPVNQHLEADGVKSAGRVGRYLVSSDLPDREDGVFMGVDRIHFTEVGYFREDFARDSLGGLMNLLALRQNAILVERSFLARNNLAIGDPLRLSFSITGETTTIPYLVAGALDMFPTLYPSEGPFFVGNLDYTFLQLGDEFRYDVWLSTDLSQETPALLGDLEEIGYRIIGHDDTRALIGREQRQPSRQGLFGLLSVGFLAAAGLTVLGFLMYSIFSFRQRFIQLGVLQAIGLSIGQLVAFLTGELLVLILTGAAAGTGLGVWASRLFIPFLQVRAGDNSQIPPFVIQIAWESIDQIYLVFGGMLLVGVIVMTVLLVRMRVFEAIKLGEVA